MPTIEIFTTPMPLSHKRAVAVRLTRWFREHGVHAAHVMLRFADEPVNTLFTGGLPIEAMSHGETGVRHARVFCGIDPKRDSPFRDRLAAEIRMALEEFGRMDFLYIEFRATDPSRVYVGGTNGLRRADEPVAAPVALA